MLRLGTAEPLRLEVPATTNPARPVYLARVASFDERTQFEAELAAPPWNAGRVYDFQLVDALEEASLERLADAPAEHRQRVAEAFHRARTDVANLPPEDRQLIADLERIEQQAPGRYSDLVAARRNRAIMLPSVAIRRFLIGWEGRDEPFTTRPDGRPDDAAMRSIPEAERLWLGVRLYAMLYLSDDEGKASPSPPQSPPGQATSRAGGGRQTAGRAGKSTARSTRKTRG